MAASTAFSTEPILSMFRAPSVEMQGASTAFCMIPVHYMLFFEGNEGNDFRPGCRGRTPSLVPWFGCSPLPCLVSSPPDRPCTTRLLPSRQVLVTLRSFDPARLRPQDCAFHPQGTLLAVGFTSGACKILDAADLEDVASFRYSSAALTAVRFSPDGEMVRS